MEVDTTSRRHRRSDVLIAVLVFVSFLVAFMLLGERPIPGLNASPTQETLRPKTLAWLSVENRELVLLFTALLGGCLGAATWRLLGLSGGYGVAEGASARPSGWRTERSARVLTSARDDVGTGAVLLVGAIAGVFCGFVVPAALLYSEAGLSAYNMRALALLGIAAGYGSCTAFGNLGRLLSDVLQHETLPVDAATLQRAIETPLRETISSKLDERFSMPEVPNYIAHLSSDLQRDGRSLLRNGRADPVALDPGVNYDLIVRMGPSESGPGHSMELRNGSETAKTPIAFHIEVDADRMEITPVRFALVLDPAGRPASRTVKLTPVQVPASPGEVASEGDSGTSFIRIAVYCNGSPAGRQLISFQTTRGMP